MKIQRKYCDGTICQPSAGDRLPGCSRFGLRLVLGFTALLWWAALSELAQAQQQYDFGDAPAVYPTLLANGGAYHLIGPVFMGPLIDAEPDGQPSPGADGDDLNPPMAMDDEDGVFFNAAFISGVPGSVTVISSLQGSILQGWVDFNGDGDWADAGEQIVKNYVMNAGSNVVPYVTPVFQVGSTGAVTYARFRLSTQQNLGYAGQCATGEVEDYKVKLSPLKWVQRPDLTTNGVDVYNGGIQLADDFLCTQTGPITDIHVWGSFKDDFEGVPPAVLSNMAFMVTIYSDVATNVNNPYSHPGDLKWQRVFGPGQYQAGLVTNIPPPGEWWHGPQPQPPGLWQHPGDFYCYQFDFYIDRTNAFSQTKSNIYWLSVQCVQQPGAYYYGWKSTYLTNRWNDDAVWLDQFVQPAVWRELRYRDGHPYANPTNQSLDLSFAISTEQEEEILYDFGDAPDGALGTGPGDYQTRQADGGAYHTIVAGAPYFDDGTQTDQPDAEPDGQPNATATGDDLNGAKPDDEDGVVIPVLTSGQPGTVNMTVAGGAGGGFVDAWIDFNADGDWLDAGEQIWSGWLVAGPNAIGFAVPPGAAIGQTFARFRINSVAAGLLPTGGPAQDGEVEDHAVTIEGEPQLDFGDAPDPAYPTLLVNNGARHVIGQLFMGASVDAELNGQPDPNALGDDNNGVPDDEDGVVFTTALISGVPAKVRVIASAPGVLQGWIDWNRDGSWAGANEQVIVNKAVVAGVNTIQFSVPNNLPAGKTFARFRLSSINGLSYAGPAPDGEVEDYEVTLYPLKWLQPPEQGSEGVDVSNGTPLADDFICTESGPITDVHIWGSFLNDLLPAGGPGSMTLTLTIYSDVPGPGYSHPGLQLWSQTFSPNQYQAANNMHTTEWWHNPAVLPPNNWMFPGDTNMYQFDFYIDPSNAFTQHVNTIYWLCVSNAATGGANFSFGWKTTPTGYAPDDACWLDLAAGGVWKPLVYGGNHPRNGQSMDLAFALSGAESLFDLDFGDAPSPYPTLLPNGARHFAVPGFYLGLAEDTEANGQPHPQALGDDLNGVPDDEDGVVFAPPLLAGTQACVNVTLTGPSGLLDAWVDFNNNGIWGDVLGEQIFASQILVSGLNSNLCFNVPTNAVLGTNFARFRLSSAGGLSPSGLAQDGEVEDYQVVIQQRVPVTNIVITNIVVTNLVAGTNVVLLQWNAQSGVQYQMQAVATFSNAPPFLWNDVGPVFIGPANAYVETNSPTLERYYRVKVPHVWP
ncbi:MAG: GEVED domain-containing protein [Verrucomicrobia bacterium]|jgi:hypothetical protein|nr:GEVED domain-containing protein [Verrucomicrobiota bacterium]